MNSIFEVNGLWYFWDETETWDYGPYASKRIAEDALALYYKQLIGN